MGIVTDEPTMVALVCETESLYDTSDPDQQTETGRHG